MENQNCSAKCLGAVIQQAITGINVDPDLCGKMSPPGPNELRQLYLSVLQLVR